MDHTLVAQFAIGLALLISTGTALYLLFEFKWWSTPKTLKEPPVYKLLQCDCDHEMKCPQGRRATDRRCEIFIEV